MRDRTHPKATAWHFVEMPRNAKAYVPSRDCVYTSRGDCAVAAAQRLTKILRSATATGAQAGGKDFGKVIDASQRGLSPGGNRRRRRP